MPLSKKCGPTARSKNIAEMRRAGHPPAQAAAAAYRTQRDAQCPPAKKRTSSRK